MDTGIIAVIIAGLISLTGIIYTVWKQSPQSGATAEANRASAFQVYWERIEALEGENNQLQRAVIDADAKCEEKLVELNTKLFDLKSENQRLWAELGQLKLRIGES